MIEFSEDNEVIYTSQRSKKRFADNHIEVWHCELYLQRIFWDGYLYSTLQIDSEAVCNNRDPKKYK